MKQILLLKCDEVISKTGVAVLDSGKLFDDLLSYMGLSPFAKRVKEDKRLLKDR